MTQEKTQSAQDLELSRRKSLGKLLRKYRTDAKMSMRVLSQSLGHSYSIVAHWENATHRVPSHELDRLEVILDIPKNELKMFRAAPGVLSSENRPTGRRMMVGLNQRLRQIRAFYKYTTDDMAAVLDMKRSQYSRVENDQAMLTVHQFMRLYVSLAIPYEQLFGHEPLRLPPGPTEPCTSEIGVEALAEL